MVLMLNDQYRYHYEILWHRDVAADVAVEPISFAYSLVLVVGYAIERKTSTSCRHSVMMMVMMTAMTMMMAAVTATATGTALVRWQ